MYRIPDRPTPPSPFGTFEVSFVYCPMIFEVKFVPTVSSSSSTKIFLELLRVTSAPSMGLDVSKVGDTYLSI